MVSQTSSDENFHVKIGGGVLKDQSGFTLIEALVVMVVGVAVLAGAAAGIGRLFAASNVSTEAQNITLIATNIQSMKDGPQGYKALSMATAKAFNVIPGNMTVSGDDKSPVVTNVWNGTVTFAPVAGDKSFDITYEGVPAEACNQLALKLKGGGWEAMQAGSASIKAESTLADIDKACKAAGGKMVFRSR